MTEVQTGQLLLGLGALFGASYLLAGLLTRLRIPSLLGALFVAIVIQATPWGQLLLAAEFSQAFRFLAQLGILFLLFFIGLQIDVEEMLGLGGDIIGLTLLKVIFTGLMVSSLMHSLGYDWLLAFVVSLTCIPTAEAVIVPILDEFRLIRTRVGEMIIGSSLLDDIVEIVLVALVSVWVSGAGFELNDTHLRVLALRSCLFVGVVFLSFRWFVPILSRWLPRRTSHLILLAMVVLFGFCGISEWSGLGVVVGALAAGVVTRPSFDRLGATGEQARQAIQSLSYGFLAPVFFFWVGLNVDLEGLIGAPKLTILFLMTAVVAKLSSALVMVPLKRLDFREGWIIAVSVNAGLTTEIIVAQLMFNAHLIDLRLFSSLVAAFSIATVGVPLVLTVLLRRWNSRGLQSSS